MINPKLLRETPDVIQTSLTHRGVDPMMFNQLRDLDISWRNKQQSLEELQAFGINQFLKENRQMKNVKSCLNYRLS